MSTTTPLPDKSALLTQAAALARRGTGSGGPSPLAESLAHGTDVGVLLDAYHRYVAPDDLAGRAASDVWGSFASHHELGLSRPQGTARVRVHTPTLAEHGWSAGGHSVVEVVAADMPFLVDSLGMALARDLHDVHVLVHPLFDVVRDVAGALQSMEPVSDGSTPPAPGTIRESWMHVEIDRIADADADRLVATVHDTLRDVREAVEDWARMNAQVEDVVSGLEQSPPPLPAGEVRQAVELLRWLGEEHFTFLGYREYRLEDDGAVLRAVPGTGLGILRADQEASGSFARLPEPVRARARDKTLLVLAKANSRATVHRPAYLDYVGVKTFGVDGEVVGERRFLGLFSSAAYTESLARIPLLREKAEEVLRRSGFDKQSHAGKSLADTLETYPRDELFHTPVEELVPIVEAAMLARERRTLRIFVRRDTYGRYLSALVYLPRERYNTTVRQRFADILQDALHGESVDFTVRIDESTTARVHFVVRVPAGESLLDEGRAPIDTTELERRLTEASRSWRDDLATAVVAEHGEETGAALARRYGDSFPEAYKEDFAARAAAVDVGRLEALAVGLDARADAEAGADVADESALDLALYQPVGAGRGEGRLKVYRVGESLSLSAVLPMLSSMGVEVVDERPYRLEHLGRPTYLYEFGLRYAGDLTARSRELFTDALRAVWDGLNEIDGFNALVLRAGITWRQASVLRAYARYMRQGGTPFAQDYIEQALGVNVDITRLLVALFEARFDPDSGLDPQARAATADDLVARIGRSLDDVVSLDHDRILRSYLKHVLATLRTNHFQTTPEGTPKSYLSLKLDPAGIPDLPQPRPRFEIFVCSPRVEGVHLRFGAVARGGLRWSDRRDDFRTEVLGLVKAQMVKNTVIVPVGAKGGFFAKQLPDTGDRDAWLAEGVASYTTFISGLLDLTDNLVDGETVPPPRVVRHDGDDSYLVVAADKGTATFSDTANAIAARYGFWLGDAFASGGSVGYDHKAMGITARGAWVSVQRHFRERGIDCQSEDFTCVGVGDMSGDVFGNGMLCSEHIRLVAAFDHRDIVLDPQPDAAASFAERSRLFALPRSSWRDYDTSTLSEGGGVFSRASKSIAVSAQACAALGIETDDAGSPGGPTTMTPAELMKAILQAPVDLLWNGGIGTYVKGSAETHAAAGDKANDAIRIDGTQLRAACVGEGGNLGLTQAGRIEYAEAGGRINTDFIDNSAGVDTSDHEVNIKILLDRIVDDGDLTEKQRNALLVEMTDEVAELVLRDNAEQNLALANALAHAPSLLHVHEEWMRHLESTGVLHRVLEGLPTTQEVRRRLDRGEGLTAPELSVLMAWTKIVLADELVRSDLPDDPYLDQDLRAYFPAPIRERFAEQAEQHPLRREIIVTQVVNDLVNGAGMTFWPRLAGETGADAAELTRANFTAREIFGSLALRQQVNALDHRLPAEVQTAMRIEMRTLVERASRWLVTHRRPPIDSQAVVDQFAGLTQRIMGELPGLMTGRALTDAEERRDALVEQGVPSELALQVAVLPASYALLGVIETAMRHDLDPADVVRVHFALGERLGLALLLQRIVALPRDDRWQTMARAALRDDLHAVHTQLTSQVLASTPAGAPVDERIQAWEESDAVVVGRAIDTLDQICGGESGDTADLARLSVGLRVVRGLLAG